jgi:hypothetical protein
MITSIPDIALRLPRHRFSDDLRALAAEFGDRRATVGDVLAYSQGRGFELLLLLVSLPFLTPISLVGLSTPFGLVVLVIGARLAVGRRPWLPESILTRQLPTRFLHRLFGAARVIVRWIEVVARPRLDFLHEQWLYRRIAGTLIAISGLLLLLPIPFPFTNTLPALTVVLLSVGALERDGLFFLGGGMAFGLTLGYFLLLAFGGAEALAFIRGTGR